MAFTLKERQILGIHGLLPPNVCNGDEQKARVMNNVRRFDNDLDKYIYLVALLDRNEKLFYQVRTAGHHRHVHTVHLYDIPVRVRYVIPDTYRYIPDTGRQWS